MQQINEMRLHTDEKKQYNHLIHTYKPILHFDSNESCYPTDVNQYVQTSFAWDKDKKLLYSPGTLTTAQLEDLGPTDCLMSDSPSLRQGTCKSLSDVPMYATVYEDDISEQLVIQYIFFYTYQTPYPICGGCVDCCHAGQHWSDVEHISIALNMDTKQPEEVYFAAHGSTQGQWKNADECKWENGTNLHVYVARHSHASYASPGTYIRICGFANDICNTEYGLVWEPKDIIYLDRQSQWNKYRGFMGYPNHVHAPAHQGWWHDESTYSATWWWRTFCCCLW